MMDLLKRQKGAFMKARKMKYIEIVERAEMEGLFSGERINLLMDIESADKKFIYVLTIG